MIIRETNLVVADNSGAKSVRAFALKGGSYRKASNIGDIVICAVKDAFLTPGSWPLYANSRKQIRQILNFLITA